MQDASTLATAHYPETLDRIFVMIPTASETIGLIAGILDYRGSFVLPDRLGLDQEMVRPHYDIQNLHPRRPRREAHARRLHRRGQHPQEVWRRA
jgi:hypothetical protein